MLLSPQKFSLLAFRILGFVLFLTSSPVFVMALPLRCATVVLAGNTPKDSLLEYDISIGQRWAAIFRFHSIRPDGVVVEIAPGARTKVGLGLNAIGFHGKLYIVEPNPTALAEVIKNYQRILPQTQIIGIAKNLDQALGEIPHSPDAVVANHPLDDMILSELKLKPKELAQVFTDSDSMAAFRASQKIWTRAQVEEVKKAQDSVFVTWQKLLQAVNPGLLAISQYESGFFKRHQFSLPDQYAGEVLHRMRLAWQTQSSKLEARLFSLGQDPERWLVANRLSLSQIVNEQPVAIGRLGPAVMIPNRLISDPAQAHDALFTDGSYLPNLKGGDWKDHLTQAMAVQIDPVNKEPLLSPTELVGWVDRQSDPLSFAMDGNEGSGRAVYVGRVFNIKGVGKTSLATSTKPSHNSGYQSLKLGTFEMVAANSLYTNLRTSTTPVVGISLKRDQSGNLTLPLSSKIMRKDENGSLDRPSHIFASRVPQTREQLLTMADALGRQDAEKLIERIFHGAYSMGNTGRDGQMLDFETLSSTRGRNPVWTLTSRWPGNYFGLEHLGHLDLLKTFVNHELNPDRVTAAEFEKTFYQGREEQMKSRFPDLMGASPLRDVYHWRTVQVEIDSLTRRFQRLSLLMYANTSLTNSSRSFTNPNMVFDFSRFMRWLPLSLRKGQDSLKDLEDLLFTQPGIMKDLTASDSLPERVLTELNPLTVTSQQQLEAYQKEARQFITDYVTLYKKVSESDPAGFEARALLVNEDRPYLGSLAQQLINTLVWKLEQKEITPQLYSRIASWMIRANDRLPRHNTLIMNVKIDLKGVQYTLVRGYFHADVQTTWNGKPVVSEWKSNLALTPTTGF